MDEKENFLLRSQALSVIHGRGTLRVMDLMHRF